MKNWCRIKRVHKNKNIDEEPSIRKWKLAEKNKKAFTEKLIETEVLNLEENKSEI